MILDELSYGDLLQRLRHDLQLDARTDILSGSIQEALGLRYGQDVLTWSGGAQQSTQTAVAHGLGRKPRVAVATMWGNISDGSGATAYVDVDGGLLTDAYVGFLGFCVTHSPGVGVTCPFFWVVLG